jgi:tetratricopeptide (TPR) repeat protein
VAIALRRDSPWVLFSRARILRSKGRWDGAIDDLHKALAAFHDRPEANQVRLELGYLYQELGDFTRARRQYAAILESNSNPDLAAAAHLNLASMDAESGKAAAARSRYDDLLARDPSDTAARHSRALLDLRSGRALRAETDLTCLLDAPSDLKSRDEILAARAISRLLLGRNLLAIRDVAEAQALRPCPAYARLRTRALLAAHRFDEIQLDRPEDILRLPVAGRRLETDLRTAERALSQLAQTGKEETYRAALNRAIILAALGQYQEAVRAASCALAVSSASPRAYLIRARISWYAKNEDGARRDVERGLRIQPHEPGLLELRGLFRLADGHPDRALRDFNDAMFFGAVDRIHIHKAEAQSALGQSEAAIQEWSLALRREPELPEAFVGRALANMQLGRWNMAVADLEQALAWAHSDPAVELRIILAYWRYVRNHPDRLPRWLELVERAARDILGAFAQRALSHGGSGQTETGASTPSRQPSQFVTGLLSSGAVPPSADWLGVRLGRTKPARSAKSGPAVSPSPSMIPHAALK